MTDSHSDARATRVERIERVERDGKKFTRRSRARRGATRGVTARNVDADDARGDGQGRDPDDDRTRRARAVVGARCVRARERDVRVCRVASRARRARKGRSTVVRSSERLIARSMRETHPGTRSSLAATATPFAWRIDLYADVDPARTMISIDGSMVTFACEKVRAEMWPTLRASAGDDATRRRRAAEREAARGETRAEARRDEEKRVVARAFVEKQWAIDDALVAATSGETRASSTEAGVSGGASSTNAREDVNVDVDAAVAPRRRASSPPPVRAFIDVTVRMTDVARAPARERRAS